MDQPYVIAIVVVVVLILSVVGYFVFSSKTPVKKKTIKKVKKKPSASASASALESAPVPVPSNTPITEPDPAPKHLMVKGWTWSDRWGVNTSNVTDPEECRRIAKENGFNAFGHRNEKHVEDHHKNTCWEYDVFEKYNGNDEDNVHVTACTDPKLSIKDGCGVKKMEGPDPKQLMVKGYYGNPVRWGVNTSNVTDPEECRRIAKENGFNAFGHRNEKHNSDGYKNTCWEYDLSGSYGGNDNDNVHVTACTDPKLSIKDGCVG